jgi:DNA-directed RNA polymerase specialized sigma24 family protein
LSSARNNELVQLDEALHRLADSNARQARVVELHYFAGLSMEQIAAILHISTRSVKHDWSLARIWLFEALRTNRS